MKEELRKLHSMTPEEYNEWSTKIYNKHVHTNDGRCQGYHDGIITNEVYNHVLERDFIDDICEED